MSKLVYTSLFALVLLLSQAAFAVHDAHCLHEVHDQACQVCSAHDHSDVNANCQTQVKGAGYGEKPEIVYIDGSLSTCALFFHSRAPPQSL